MIWCGLDSRDITFVGASNSAAGSAQQPKIACSDGDVFSLPHFERDHCETVLDSQRYRDALKQILAAPGIKCVNS